MCTSRQRRSGAFGCIIILGVLTIASCGRKSGAGGMEVDESAADVARRVCDAFRGEVAELDGMMGEMFPPMSRQGDLNCLRMAARLSRAEHKLRVQTLVLGGLERDAADSEVLADL